MQSAEVLMSNSGAALEVMAAESSAAEVDQDDPLESDGSFEGSQPNKDISIPAVVKQAVYQLPCEHWASKQDEACTSAFDCRCPSFSHGSS